MEVEAKFCQAWAPVPRGPLMPTEVRLEAELQLSLRHQLITKNAA